jgi:hypothetical protein
MCSMDETEYLKARKEVERFTFSLSFGTPPQGPERARMRELERQIAQFENSHPWGPSWARTLPDD